MKTPRRLALAFLAVVVAGCSKEEGDTIIVQQGGVGPLDAQVLFKANPTTVNRYDYFATDLEGSQRINLTQLPGAASLLEGLWSPDRAWLAYRAVVDTPGTTELYVVAVPDGTPVKVSVPLPLAGGVAFFDWAPDSSRIAYVADENVAGRLELYTVTPSGAGRIKVSGTLVGGGAVNDFKWSPDSTRLLYNADQDVFDENELYVVPAAGGAVVQVSGALVSGGTVSGVTYAWAPDGSRISYVAAQDAVSVFELFTSLPTGAGNVQVSGALVGGGNVLAVHAWAPDSSRIAYHADQETLGTYELYSSLPAGGGNVEVSAALVAGQDVELGWAWSPDSSRIAYIADQDTPDILELYTGLADGSGQDKVSGTMVLNGGVALFNLRWAPDGSRIAYLANQDDENEYELFTSLPDGTGNVQVSSPLALGEDVDDQFYYWSPDSTRLLYRTSGSGGGNIVYKVWTALAAGGEDGLVNSSLSSFMMWTDDSSRVVFTSQDVIQVNVGTFVPGPMELFTALPDGSDARRISGDMVPTADHTVFSFDLE